MVIVKQTHWMEDVVEAAAGGEAVVWVDPLQASDSQEHSDGRAESKEGLGVEVELWVVNRYLQRRNNTGILGILIYNTGGFGTIYSVIIFVIIRVSLSLSLGSSLLNFHQVEIEIREY